MKDKKLEIVLSVLIDILLKSKKFRLLEQEQEKIEEILQLFISEEQITFLGNTSASNQPYLYLIPEYYSLTNELIDKINAKFDLYTTDNNEYYKVWLNDSGILVKISINRDSFNKTEKNIYPK
ncbi:MULTISPECIES: hypothetical protein [Staphylococcus]|uniref:hypothetical protein n=1 Tax=Staphylococcus TaxID=1279 RepID=UPI001CEF90FC|nr:MULTISPECIES: hypothetical protein [Staphylococcus]MDH8979357.1 hypothetical protein [Staphylococcus epidermidis]MDH8981631.1 hypothetical protein [Staphylococcus epidermidis]MDH8988583.1 hypothetical protein [Staphylococcus epidermidis]MDH8993326.1 hypothetical protein [Staphylococcus epidermidis]MDH8995615.1 hypothetical protein [Staphylococcus epidermidis]